MISRSQRRKLVTQQWWLALVRLRRPDDESFVRAAYRTLLRREPDPDGYSQTVAALAHGATRDEVLAGILQSEEIWLRQNVIACVQTTLSGNQRRKLTAQRWWLALRDLRRPDDRTFVRAAYRALLGREPDSDGCTQNVAALAGGAAREQVLSAILQSEEYQLRQNLPMMPGKALHNARLEYIRHRVPAARIVVDLGGAANQSRAGALLLCGYPHRPETIYIVDLPDERRMLGSGEPESGKHGPDVRHRGVMIRYLYQSMAEPVPLGEGAVDLVFSGESIEHITETEADLVCREAWRLLRPGGHFCLDTPNGALTRLQSPEALIHPEHKKEYRPCELRAKLEAVGFEVVEEGAICPMPESLRSGRFLYKEMVNRRGLSANPDEGYLFYLIGRKPPAENIAA